MELANAFYIIGIICMSLITLLMIAIIAAVIFIKIKIDHIHRAIESHVAPVKQAVETVGQVAKKAKEKFTK